MRAVCLLLVAVLAMLLLATPADAHKSVRFRRPETEEERADHAAFHRRRPEHHKRVGHDEPVPDHEGGSEPYFHRSKSYHRQFGPRHDGQNLHMKAHHPEKRYDNQGHEIPLFVRHDDNPKDDPSRRPIV